MDEKLKKRLLFFQKVEILESHLYAKIAGRAKKEEDKRILKKISEDEARHSEIIKKHTGEDVKVDKFKLFILNFISIIFGYTFIIKKMESGESRADELYGELAKTIPDFEILKRDEEKHEHALIEILDEERLKYVGAMVLGLNDALVELTGVIAGVTFAIRDNKYIALTGIITGIAATLSMGASNFLAEKADGNKDAFKSSLYTGFAYLITVVLMVMPYLLFPIHAYLPAFIVMLIVVILIIFVFNYYISVTKEVSFKNRFLEMLIISLSVAVISFVIGIVAKNVLGVDV
jgi:VIT1/CCC1 family predicted Fe2+/Mn2+ transporter